MGLEWGWREEGWGGERKRSRGRVEGERTSLLPFKNWNTEFLTQLTLCVSLQMLLLECFCSFSLCTARTFLNEVTKRICFL